MVENKRLPEQLRTLYNLDDCLEVGAVVLDVFGFCSTLVGERPMTVESVNSEKQRLRQKFRQLREALPAGDVGAASEAVCRHLASWPVMRTARIVMAYLAFRNEPSLETLFAALPRIQWAVPRIEGRTLVIHPYDPNRLTRHPFGMLEPAADLPVIDPALLEIVLVPGVAFDRRGGRLGFGGGFYDRFLPTTPAPRVGVTYDFCLLDELPWTEADQRMDWVVTPTGLLKVR
ncbi:MAG: 5-formyltetrahydrofolate cyclo-ligase [Anaerolineae bacterium]